MTAMTAMLNQLWQDESATATVEYALLTAVLVGAGAGAWIALKDVISSVIAEVAEMFSSNEG